MNPDRLETLTASPADSFRYCPRCGAADPKRGSGRSLRCGECGFLFFFNAAAAVGAFVFHQGRLVLCVRAREPGRGMLGVPGGFVDFDESAEEALGREIREELRLEVAGFRYLCSAPNRYAYAGVAYRTADFYFVCEAPDISGIQAADDVADYLLIAPEALDPARLAFSSARRAFAALMSQGYAAGSPR
jgi:ADP-ribose pyrophosphatase YjhB (NUDIX family)